MANKPRLIQDVRPSAQQGKNPGPVNSKPQAISVKTVSPGYRPNDQVVKPGGK